MMTVLRLTFLLALIHATDLNPLLLIEPYREFLVWLTGGEITTLWICALITFFVTMAFVSTAEADFFGEGSGE